MAFNTVPFHGKVCRVEKNNVAVAFTEGWQANIQLATVSKMSQGENWESDLAGAGSWSGSFNAKTALGNTEQKAFLDNLIAAVPGVVLTDVKLLFDVDTNALTGDIMLTGVSFNNPLTDKATVTFNFKGQGAPSLGSAE